MRNQHNGLARLRARIVRELYLNEWRDVWFFPQRDGVEGWRGMGRVMIFGLNPSTTHRWTDTIKGFYSTLRRLRLHDAHLTDVLKERMTAPQVRRVLADPREAAVTRHRCWLRHEVDLLRPRRILAMGDQVRQVLDSWLGPDRRVQTIPHYAPRFPDAAKRRRFAVELARATRNDRRAAR